MSSNYLSQEFANRWLKSALNPQPGRVRVEGKAQGWSYLRFGQSVDHGPLRVDGRAFEHGLGTHADSEIDVTLDSPAVRLRGWVGVDDNPGTRLTVDQGIKITELVFSVEVGGKQIWASPPVKVTDTAVELDLPLDDAKNFTLKAEGVNGDYFGHANWCDLAVTLADGTREWVGDSQDTQRLPAGPPFSFVYGGKPSAELLPSWKVERKIETPRSEVTVHTTTYTDPATGLACIWELMEFANFPAAEWVVRFRNDGDSDTPILEDIQALDIGWTATQNTNLHRSRGSNCDINDFAYQSDAIPHNTKISMVAGGGRSSDNWVPFFNLQTADRGVVTAIGWSGQWAASFERGKQDDIKVRAGLELSHLKLHPGEEIRTPSIALVFWQGEPIDGNNLLRRFIIKHHTPIVDGEPLLAPMTSGMWGGIKSKDHLKVIEFLQEHDLKYDYYWIDAGWYGTAESYSPTEMNGTWFTQAGNWNPNPIGHPEGLRGVSDAANKAGMKFLLWFEPERAVWGTAVTQEHPEWFLGEQKPGASMLLNLGNKEAREWLTDFISNRIQEWNIKCFRQDFNFEPLPYWRNADAPDRQGMAESGHIAGLYWFWDELVRRNPGLIIDNCASGGRRLDLELTSRAIPLWRSDYQCFGTFDPLGSQIHTCGLSYWIPLSGTGSYIREGDTYNFRSCMSAAQSFGAIPPEHIAFKVEYQWDWHRKMLADHRRARPLYYGDYYPLTKFSTGRDTWAAYQLDRPDLDSGMALAFRREDCPFTSADLRLRGLNLDAEYLLENSDTGETWKESGRALSENGLHVTLSKPRESVLIFYRKAVS